MDIKITDYFRIWYLVEEDPPVGPTGTEPVRIALKPNSPFPFGLTLAAYAIKGELWGFAGTDSEGKFLGFGPALPAKIQVLADLDDGLPHELDICFAALTTPVPGYTVVLSPCKDSITSADSMLHYTIVIEGPSGPAMPLKFIIGPTHKSPFVDVDKKFREARARSIK